MSDAESGANAPSDTPDSVLTSDQGESKLCGTPKDEKCTSPQGSECVPPSLPAEHVKRTQPLLGMNDHPAKPQLTPQSHIVQKIRIQVTEGETNDFPRTTLNQTASTQAIAGETPDKGETEEPEGVPGKEEAEGASGQVEEVTKTSGGSSQKEPATQGESKGACGGPPDDSGTITEQNNIEDGATSLEMGSQETSSSENDGIVKLKLDASQGTLDYESKCHRKDSAKITESLATLTHHFAMATIKKQTSESSLSKQKDVSFYDRENGNATKLHLDKY